MHQIADHLQKKMNAKLTREEQAAQELGITYFEKGTREALVSIFLIVIVSVPLLQMCCAFREPERVTGLISGLRALLPTRDQIKSIDGMPSAINLLPNSSQIKSVEDDWERNSVVGETLLPKVQSLLLSLGQGNEKAYIGRDGWLFYRSDVDFVTGRGFLEPSVLKKRLSTSNGAKSLQPDPLKAILDFRDQLAARNIELVVMPAPAKPSIYPEWFSAEYEDKRDFLRNRSYDEFKKELSQAGVMVFDPAQLLLEQKERSLKMPLYLKTDTHWTPAAMERTASVLATQIRNNIKLSQACIGRFIAEPQFVTNLGDIATMLKLPAEQTMFSPERVQIRKVLDNGKPWHTVADSEVLFLGDSFANIYSLEQMGWGESAGFAEHLSLALGLPLDAICRNDAGSHATREMLANDLRRGIDRLAGKKVVIWEFAARELCQGDWKIIPLAVGEKKQTDFYSPRPGETITVRGVVGALSSSPAPGTVPYKDHILTIHLKNLECSQDAAINGREAVVFAWSMRDNKSMPASHLRLGETVELCLQSWFDVAAQYEKINRSELDDSRLLLADGAWASEIKANTSIKDELLKTTDVRVAPSVPSIKTNAEGVGSNFRKMCADMSATGDGMTIPAKNGWLFLRSELRHIGVGEFWGDAASGVSRATSPEKTDPLPAIVDFNKQLKEMGIELIVAPVPCKAFIYPEALGATSTERLDSSHQQFFDTLRKSGVNVLDLTELFLREKAKPNSPLLYCKMDSHWSAFACELTARTIAEYLKHSTELKGSAGPFTTRLDSRRVRGDLSDGKDSEELPVRIVEPASQVEDKSSPIVLLGDSHTLVFHSGADLHGTAAGLADQLAAEINMPIDVIGVRGSGATPARINFMRRAKGDPSYLAKKKVVIWCFASREFTESSGWSVFKLK